MQQASHGGLGDHGHYYSPAGGGANPNNDFNYYSD
jgi:hypothetical protein